MIDTQDNPEEVEAFTPDESSFEAVADAARLRLAQNKPVRRNLPDGGRLRVDRQLPFICVYRTPPGMADNGTRELVTSEAAYLFAAGDDASHAGLCYLCRQVNEAMREHFGTYLFLEIWSDPLVEDAEEWAAGKPAFEVVAPDMNSVPTTIDAFKTALGEIEVHGRKADVTLTHGDVISPPNLPPLTSLCADEGATGCCALGVAVKPIYRDPQTGALYPLVLQQLRWQLSHALRKAIAEFTGLEAGSDNIHYQSLGPSSLVKAARIVDQQLCEVSEAFDFLLQVTPTNADRAWEEFRDSDFQDVPPFQYRPLPYRPSLLKRRLFDIEIERIEDPTLAHVFWEKQIEVDRQLSALRDLNSPEFLYSSQQLFGTADERLVTLAREILTEIPHRADNSTDEAFVPVATFAEHARDEIDHYRQQFSEFNATVEVCDHIAAGIMVSHDRLLISDRLSIRPRRIEPLLHHEIGTHLLTYFNGRCQPFRQLYAGLAGHDELQEGLAVLAEYLCGGLTARRLRSLAGRVVAVQSMSLGNSFHETFVLLRDEYGFSARRSFVTTLRVHRGGGITKDVIYLRGLRDLLEYLGKGHDIEPLYVGKIGLQHLPYVQELRRRGIIDAPRVLPRFWDDDIHRERLDACRGLSVLQLMENTR